MSAETREQFVAEAKKRGFVVEFSRKVARVIRYSDGEGELEFTLDAGPNGDHSITIDPPVTHPEWKTESAGGRHIRLALERTKGYLEACGFEVDMDE